VNRREVLCFMMRKKKGEEERGAPTVESFDTG
jgi:hypothetical protein